MVTFERSLAWRSRHAQAGCGMLQLLAFCLPIAISQQAIAGTVYPAFRTYELQRIQPAPSGWALEASVWVPHRLSSDTKDKVALFSFFYSICRDPQRCPKAGHALPKGHAAIKTNASLHSKVRLPFLSSDPKGSTPEMMAAFQTSLSAPEARWTFLATWPEPLPAPIRNNVYAPAARKFAESRKRTNVIDHRIKVFGSSIRGVG